MAKRTRPEQRPLTDTERRTHDHIDTAYSAGDGLDLSNHVFSVNIAAGTPMANVGGQLSWSKVSAQADVATSDAIDLLTVLALANDLKGTVNGLLAKLRTANVMET